MWLEKILGFDYEIIYLKWAESSVVDALSHLLEDISFYAITSPIFSYLADIAQEYQANPNLSLFIARLQSSQAVSNYSYNGSGLLYKGCIVIPSFSLWRQRILHKFHASLIGGHYGFLSKFYKSVATSFYWKELKNASKIFVAECGICQWNKGEYMHPSYLLQPLPIPDKIWEDIYMDFINGLPPSDGKTSIFIDFNRLSKYAHFSALSHPYTTAIGAKVFV